MAKVYAGFNEIHELYNSFEWKYDVLQDHHTRRMTGAKVFDNMLDWHKHIKDKAHVFSVMDKLQTNKTKVTIET